MKGDLSSTTGVVPLRTILRNFLNLVENCEAKRNGGLDSYDKEFQELKLFSESLKSDSGYMCKEGEKPVNRKKNRYKDILPFDYTRVILSDYGDIPGSDYINANFIKGASGSSAYIACQGPLPHTVNDFWRMVVECEVQVIVMACNEQESGKHKCENYWVEENGVERQFGQVTIWLKKCRSVCPDFLVRTMRIRFINAAGESEERNVCQFHYSAWPDHGVPTKVRPLLDMVRLIRDCQTSETLPVLVHCSAGCGRTGTICAIDYVWGLLRLGKLTPDFSLYHLVRDMRRQRIAMVQTKDQYILVHRAVRELFQEQLKIIEAHPYANVDQNGLPLEIKAELVEPTYETIDYRQRDTCGIKKPPPELNCIGKSSVQDVLAPDSVPSDSASSAVALPPKNPLNNSKLEKEVENHQKLQDQIRSKIPAPIVNHSQREISPAVPANKNSSQTSNLDEIKSLPMEPTTSPDSSLPKPPSHSSSKSSLLRKPSIVKLKAFFEKNKDDKEKKTGSTQLSRAKSDVSSSSRFYTQNSKASSVSPTNEDKATAQPVKIEKPESSSTSRKYLGIPKSKPMLLAKPTLPVKRSKSLKSHHTDSSFEPRGLTQEIRPGPTSSYVNSNDSTSSVVSTDAKNPIRVCVKQVEMPKLQKVVSKSIKLEAQQAQTTEKLFSPEFQINSSSQSVSSGTSSSHTLQKDQSKVHEDGKGKPQVPMRTHGQSLKLNHNYANVAYNTNRIKMGLAKEMEDVRDLEGNSSAVKLSKIKKYETVNPKSIASGRTALTRSHSHVWQSDKVSLPIRIFSDENLHQTGSNSSPLVKSFHANENAGSHSSRHSNVGNSKPSASESFFDSLFNKSSIQNPSNSSYLKPEGTNPYLSAENPVIRRQVPKTNPYTNYPSGSPKRNSKIMDHESTPPFNEVSTDSRIKENVPRLKSSHGNSVGNSSDSSSNAGTPRNSLPSTPTQSIDLLYSQLSRTTAGNGNDSNLSMVGLGRGGIPNPPPKSILKGSLSSTPSESEEKLDSGRPALNSNPIFSAPKLNTIRIAVGIRERRNSFRQAVWKEEQGNSPPKSNSVHPFPPGSVYPSTSASSTIALQNGSVKTHKDYEPIWPDSSNANAAFRLGSNKVSDSSLRTSLPHNQASHSVNPSNDSRLKPIQDSGTTVKNYPPKMKNRVEEIKGLLEELKTPTGGLAAGVDSNNYGARNQVKSNSSSPGTSLKHQRSLRVVSRPQYQQGLSCFTFKKPSSYESITDHLQAEEYQPLVKPGNSVFYNGTHNSQPEDRLSSSFMDTRQGNDYVVLGQCRTAGNSQSSSGGRGEIPPMTFGAANFNHTPIPVPPPRTKRHQSSSPKRNNSFEDEIRAAPLTIWMGSQTGISSTGPGAAGGEKTEGGAPTSDSRHLNEDTREGSRSEDMPINSSASPKAIIKALGLFQAKAANVRSRFINWTEAKDRHGKKPETNSEMPIADFEDSSHNEQNFEQSSKTGPQAGPSWSKHQYL